MTRNYKAVRRMSKKSVEKGATGEQDKDKSPGNK